MCKLFKVSRSCYYNWIKRGSVVNKVDEEEPVFVDISYYGHTQEMLSHILNKKTAGYYFVADLSEQNECNKKNKISRTCSHGSQGI